MLAVAALVAACTPQPNEPAAETRQCPETFEGEQVTLGELGTTRLPDGYQTAEGKVWVLARDEDDIIYVAAAGEEQLPAEQLVHHLEERTGAVFSPICVRRGEGWISTAWDDEGFGTVTGVVADGQRAVIVTAARTDGTVTGLREGITRLLGAWELGG